MTTLALLPNTARLLTVKFETEMFEFTVAFPATTFPFTVAELAVNVFNVALFDTDKFEVVKFDVMAAFAAVIVPLRFADVPTNAVMFPLGVFNVVTLATLAVNKPDKFAVTPWTFPLQLPILVYNEL